MSNLTIFQFESCDVRIAIIDGEPWFVATDVLRATGSTTAVTALKRMIEEEIGGRFAASQVIIDTMNREQKMLCLSKTALKLVLQKSRKPKAKELAQALDLDLDVMQSPIESECVRIIQKAFAHMEPIDQFFVSGYRIDLYFPRQRLAVECDETHHKYCEEKDFERRSRISRILGCRWVIFSPYEKGFNIGDVINEIMQKICRC